MNVAIMGTGTVALELARELRERRHTVLDGVDGAQVVVDVGRDGAPAAGVEHYVLLSQIGVDRVGGRYHRAKLAQEAAVRESGVPWTIVRTTQLHTMVARTFAASARLGVLPVIPAPLQPVDPREVARALADTAEAEPSYAITQLAGPEVVSGRELAWRWRAATGSRALPVRLPVTRSIRSGGLTNRGAWQGRITFDAWLAS